MKLIQSFSFLFLLSALHGAPGPKVPLPTVKTLTTKQGTVYEDVQVTKVEFGGIRISHKAGAAFIKKEDVPDTLEVPVLRPEFNGSTLRNASKEKLDSVFGHGKAVSPRFRTYAAHPWQITGVFEEDKLVKIMIADPPEEWASKNLTQVAELLGFKAADWTVKSESPYIASADVTFSSIWMTNKAGDEWSLHSTVKPGSKTQVSLQMPEIPYKPRVFK